ncbi:nectin-2 isoform X2 [Pelobates cultripes]|uniref:Nectin-2 isoform X2 n=1 Tax=Pelobates cultripes TaxID=61616 RepID=A0AAD1WRE2_PELCU|nr:nectin-2 isoform X2 [Pelobates cultripes]
MHSCNISSPYYIFSVLQAQELRVNDKVTGNLLQEALLPCSFVSADQNARVSQAIWFKDGANIAAYSPALGIKVKDSDRIQFVNPSDTSTPLRITKLLASDEGKYTCEVSIFPEGNFKGTTQLNVQAVPQNSANVVQVVAGDQEMTVATCTSANGRPPAQITWQTSVPGNVTTDMTNNTDGTYTLISNYRITPTWTADGEKITCTVTHDGKETAIPLKLSVQYTPVVTIEGYDDNWHLNRKGASLTCNAQGNPPPTIFKWTTANGSPLPPSVHVNGKILYVDQMDENVNTTFKCEVTNAIGSRASQQEVLVREHAMLTQTNNAGAIAGGVIGGVLVLLLLAAVIFIVIKRNGLHSAKGRGSYSPKTRVFGTGKPSQEFNYQEDSELDRPLKGTIPPRDSGLSPSLCEEDDEERMDYKVLEDEEEEEKFNEVGPMLQLRPHPQVGSYLDDDMESQTDGSIISRTAVYV